MPSLTLALGLLGLALGLAASWLTLPCPHFWAARELRVLRMGANASSAATERVQPTLGSLLGARSLGSLLGGAGGIWGAPAADAYTSNGSRLQCASEATPKSTVYLADAGRPWQWAAERPGHERRVLLPGDQREFTLATLAIEPALFRVRGLLTAQEAAALYAAAEPKLQPAQVRSSSVSGAELRADAGRTTAAAWLHGHQDPRREVAEARQLQRRVAALLRLPEALLASHVEPVLVEAAAEGQFYVPHVDYLGAYTSTNPHPHPHPHPHPNPHPHPHPNQARLPPTTTRVRTTRRGSPPQPLTLTLTPKP